MCAQTKFKAFVNPNHRVLETDFNTWVNLEDNPLKVIDTSLTYSASLQKFILAVVYEQGECKCSAPVPLKRA
jgi:hypothetical protein